MLCRRALVNFLSPLLPNTMTSSLMSMQVSDGSFAFNRLLIDSHSDPAWKSIRWGGVNERVL